MNNWRDSFLMLLILGMAISCNFNPDGVQPPSWKSSFIGPLVNSRVTLEDLVDFDSLKFNYEVLASELSNDIPPGGGQLPLLPPFQVNDLPPDTFNISEGFQYAIFDSGEIFFEFVNDLPVILNSGQIISIYSVIGPNQDQKGDRIFDFTLTEDLQPGETATSVFTEFTGLVVSSRLIIEIDTVSSPGSNSPVSFDAESGFNLSFEFRNLKVREIGVNSGNTFELGDTSAFTFNSGTVPSTLEGGLIKIKLRNGIPLAVDLNLDLLDENQQQIGNLVEGGDNIVEASDTSSIIIEINETNLDLLNNTQYLVSKVFLRDQATIGDTVIINSDSLIRASIIGELELNLVQQ